MASYILLSGVGWETGFCGAALRAVKSCVTDTARLLYVASDPANYKKTDENTRAFTRWLSDFGIVFDSCAVLDNRMPEDERQAAIERASCVFLCGGDTLAQIDFLKGQKLVQPLRRHGFVVGLSAGSINMAGRSVLLVNPYRERTRVYEGVGLTDVTVIPHFDPGREELYRRELFPLSYDGPIYGLCDDAVIVVRDGRKRHAGTIYKIDHGHMRLMNDEDSL